MKIEFLEPGLLTKGQKEIIDWLMEGKFIKNERKYLECNTFMMLVPYTRGKNGYAWRCMSTECDSYKKFFSMEEYSFLMILILDLK